MAGRWSLNLRQGLRVLGKLSNSAPSGEVVSGSTFRAAPSEESGLRSVVVAGLVFCTTSGALCTEQLNGRNEREHVGERVATQRSSVEIEEAPSTPTGDNDDIVKFSARTPFGRVSNAFALSGASRPESAAKDSSAGSPSSQGGCLNRFAIADAAARAAPAVVNIKLSIGTRNAIYGESAGSGFIIKSDGTIVTNAHVVIKDQRGNFKGSLSVTLQDGRNFDAKLVDYDLLSDLAVIKVSSSTPLPVVKLGTTKDLRPGEWVIALGSPLHLQNSVTAGIISCVDRKSTEMGIAGIAGVTTAYIQTDAAVNQGNSGGPLINLEGEVIGINTMKAMGTHGVSFAIPIDAAFKIMNQLKKSRRVIRPWLGMKMYELTEPRILQLKEIYPGFPDVTAGIFVSQVIPGSPASGAGVHNDDVIIAFDGAPVTNINQIVEALGDKVGITFKMVVKRRNNEVVDLYVTSEEATPET